HSRIERRTTVAHKMLRAGEHREWVTQSVTLQAADRSFAKLGNEPGFFRKTFVGASPPIVAGYRDARGEIPLDAGRPHLLGRDAIDFFHQLWIAGAAEADV